MKTCDDPTAPARAIKPGDRFGRLVVKAVAPKQNGKPMWNCLCEPAFGGCGRYHTTQEATLLSGAVTSCGCGHAAARKTLADMVEAPMPSTAANIKGEVFGRLRVISYAGRPPGFKRSAWNVHCAPDLGGCDNYLAVISNSLRTGNSTSCGCLRGDRLTGRVETPWAGRAPTADPQKGAEFIDLTDWPEPFGTLRVRDRAPNRIVGKVAHTMWNCFCDPELGGCGRMTVQTGTRLRKRIVGSCGCLKHTGAVTRSEEVRVKARAYLKRRRATDPRFVVECRMRARLRGSLKRIGKTRSSRRMEEILGYTVEELEAHLKTTLPEGYTWDDFLAGKGDRRLDIEHEVELWKHAYTSEDDPAFKEAWALKNLRLFPKVDHDKKTAASHKERAGHLKGGRHKHKP